MDKNFKIGFEKIAITLPELLTGSAVVGASAYGLNKIIKGKKKKPLKKIAGVKSILESAGKGIGKFTGYSRYKKGVLGMSGHKGVMPIKSIHSPVEIAKNKSMSKYKAFQDDVQLGMAQMGAVGGGSIGAVLGANYAIKKNKNKNKNKKK